MIFAHIYFPCVGKNIYARKNMCGNALYFFLVGTLGTLGNNQSKKCSHCPGLVGTLGARVGTLAIRDIAVGNAAQFFVWRCHGVKQMTPANTGDPALDLLAAIVMRALIDARGRGEAALQAAQWLDEVCPEWRGITRREELANDRARVSRPQGRTGRAQQRALLYPG